MKMLKVRIIIPYFTPTFIRNKPRKFSWDSPKQNPNSQMAMQIHMHFSGRAKCSICRWHVEVQQPFIALHTHRCTWISSAFSFKADQRRHLSPPDILVCRFYKQMVRNNTYHSTSIIYTQLIHSHVHFTLLSARRHSQLSLFSVCLVWLSWWRSANTCHRFDYTH